MDTSEALDFLRQHHYGVLATTRSDGLPQLSPVAGTVDDRGRLVVSSRETAYKVRNLRRRPYASYCGFTDRFFGDWVQVEGPVEVIALPEAMDPLVAHHRGPVVVPVRVLAGHRPVVGDQRVIVAITPERAGPNRAG